MGEAGGTKKNIHCVWSRPALSLCMHHPRWMFLFSSLPKQGNRAKQVGLPSPLAGQTPAPLTSPPRKKATGEAGPSQPPTARRWSDLVTLVT